MTTRAMVWTGLLLVMISIMGGFLIHPSRLNAGPEAVKQVALPDVKTLFIIKGKEVYTTYSRSIVRTTAQWSPETAEPPVTMKEAVHTARAALAKMFPDASKWLLYSCCAERVFYEDLHDDPYWIWQVTFIPTGYDGGLTTEMIEIGVYMNGKPGDIEIPK